MRRVPNRAACAGFFIAMVAGLTQIAIGQEALTAPRAIDQARPAPPVNRRGVPVEGWAVVRYSVLADGTTDNVRVVDIAPPAVDSADIVASVARWTFTPASADGEAIDWHNNESVILFDSADVSPEASQAFTDAYEAIAVALDDAARAAAEAQASASGEQAPADVPDEATTAALAQALDEARAANDVLLNELALSKQDICLALAQGMIIRQGQLDLHGALRFVTLAADPRVNCLPGEELLVALQLQLRLETQLGRTQDAIETFERIVAGLGPDDSNPFAQIGQSLQSNWNNAEILEVLGQVDDRPWRIDAGRRMFTIDNVDGRVHSIDAECNRRRITLEFQPDVDWQLPDSFGDCVLLVNADSGTTFSFFELLPAG